MAATICPRPMTLTFDVLTLKLVWELDVTWGTPVQSFIFLGLLVFELEAMYVTSNERTEVKHDRLHGWSLRHDVHESATIVGARWYFGDSAAYISGLKSFHGMPNDWVMVWWQNVAEKFNRLCRVHERHI